MPTWPTTLPPPNVSGYGVNPIDPAVRTDMETGAARSRRRTAARNDQVAATWIFTDAQMAIFRAWFDDPANAAGGAAWFTVNLALGTSGRVSVSARFVGVWQSTALDGLHWSVTAKLEIR